MFMVIWIIDALHNSRVLAAVPCTCGIRGSDLQTIDFFMWATWMNDDIAKILWARRYFRLQNYGNMCPDHSWMHGIWRNREAPSTVYLLRHYISSCVSVPREWPLYCMLPYTYTQVAKWLSGHRVPVYCLTWEIWETLHIHMDMQPYWKLLDFKNIYSW